MKTTKQLLTLFSLLFIGVIVFTSCGSKDKPKQEKESYMTAHVAIGNGIAFDFKGDHATGISAVKSKLGVGFLDAEKGVSIYLAINAPQGGLKEGSYSVETKVSAETGTTASLKLSPVNTDLFPDKFDTRTNLDDDIWNEGTGNITITSLDKNWVEGTFSVVAYSNAGDEAQITEGKFRIKVDYKF